MGGGGGESDAGPSTAAASAALVVAPLLLLVAALLEAQVEHPLAAQADADADAWVAQHIVLAVATALLVPAALGVLLLAKERALAVLGFGFVLLGVLGATGIFAMDFVAVELADAGERQAMQDLYERMLRSPGIRTFEALQFALPVGILVIAAAVFRAHTIPRWAAVSIALGALLGTPALGEYVTIGARLLLLVGFAVAAFALLGGWRRTGGTGTEDVPGPPAHARARLRRFGAIR